MRWSRSAFMIHMLAWLTISIAHEPGQEFTYLSLFQKPASERGYTQREMESLASQYLKKHSLTSDTRRQRLRRLQSETQNQASEETVETDDYEFSGSSQKDQDPPSEGAPTTAEETEKADVEEIEGARQSEEVEASTTNDEEEANEPSQGEPTPEPFEVKAPQKVVRVLKDSALRDASGDAKQLNSGRVKGSKTRNKKSGSPVDAKQLSAGRVQGSKTKKPGSMDARKPKSLALNKEEAGAPKLRDPKDSEIAQEGRRNGENLKRLSMMLMKIVKQYNVRSLVDVPCRAHSHWMPIFLMHVAAAKLKKPFKYYCVDTNKEILKLIKKRLNPKVNAKFVLKKFWKEPLPSGDLVFSWAGLDNMKEENVLKYIERLSVSKHKLVLLGSHSGKLEKDGSVEKISRFTFGGKPINLRREPFKLAKPMRIVDELSTEGNDKKLYLYQPKEMIRTT